MKMNQTNPLPKPADTEPRDPRPAPGPSSRPTSAGQSQKSLKSETGKTHNYKTSDESDTCGCAK